MIKQYFCEYTHAEITVIILGSIIISALLILIPRKYLKYLNIVLGITFVVFNLIAINNTAITLQEALPFYIFISFYTAFYYVKDLFKIKLNIRDTKEQ